ncbi:unnamed protein product [Calypogeia fissa]
MELQARSLGVLSTSYPCHAYPRRFLPLKACLRQSVPTSCISWNLNQSTNTCRPWTPLGLDSNGVRMFKCNGNADARFNDPIDVEAKTVSEVEDDDYPLWMEEDDPNWPEEDPNGDGVGFKVDNFFKPKIVNEPNEDGSVDEDAIDFNWEAEQYQWVLREISSIEWEMVALEDPTPLLFFAFERYGPSGPECWKTLEEVEKVVRTIVESRKYPVRAVKLDISSEPAVGDALEIMMLPALLFIKNGKLLYRLYGVKPADEILAIASHLFYHSTRPACMDELDTSPHRVVSISSSGS